ncbi:hypothetical protein GW916_12970 [bacterium]|nr:hypothetical protein [bacterium]
MTSKIPLFAFLRIKPDFYAFGDAHSSGWKTLPVPPEVGPYFWAPDFFLEDPEPFFIPKSLEFLSKEELLHRLKSHGDPQTSSSWSPTELRWESPEKELFEKSFRELKSLIEKKELLKAVPVVIQAGHGEESKDPLKLWAWILSCLDRLPEELQPFGLVTNQEWMFGATPETLVSRSKNKVSTEAVAGTSSDFHSSLLKDPKERFEHQLVVDQIKSHLESQGQVEESPCFEKELPLLKHLVTPLAVELSHPSKSSLIELGQRLHPTPALGGFPQKEAFDWLKSLPRSNVRRRYGAPFGFVTDSGEGHLVVAIRCLQKSGEDWLSIAGAGVVGESEMEKEWIEIESKRLSVLEIFRGVLYEPL